MLKVGDRLLSTVERLFEVFCDADDIGTQASIGIATSRHQARKLAKGQSWAGNGQIKSRLVIKDDQGHLYALTPIKGPLNKLRYSDES